MKMNLLTGINSDAFVWTFFGQFDAQSGSAGERTQVLDEAPNLSFRLLKAMGLREGCRLPGSVYAEVLIHRENSSDTKIIVEAGRARGPVLCLRLE